MSEDLQPASYVRVAPTGTIEPLMRGLPLLVTERSSELKLSSFPLTDGVEGSLGPDIPSSLVRVESTVNSMLVSSDVMV